MPRPSLYVLASLVSPASAALILASAPSHTDARFPQGTAYNTFRGQSTHNGCRASPCEVAFLNSAEDFCLWAPQRPTPSAPRDTEHTLVAWCMKSGHGTHLIPDGTVSEAHLVINPEYVQISGVGNLTGINVPASGVASASGEADRVHGLVFTRAYGQLEQIHDWTSFVSQERFCFRACNPSVTPPTTCSPVHDILECSENVPGNYDTGVFRDCVGGMVEALSTLNQEILGVPSRYCARSPSRCTTRDTIRNAQANRARRAIPSTSGSASTSFTSSVAPTTADTVTSITSSTIPTSVPYSYVFRKTFVHGHGHSRHHSSTLSTSLSLSYTQSSSSTTSSFGDFSVTTSASSPASSFMFTSSTYSSTDPSMATSSSTPTLASTPMPSSPLPSSSDGTSSSLSPLSSSQPSSYPSSAPSSVATPVSSPAQPSTPSSASQSSDVLTFITSSSPSSFSTASTASPSLASPSSQTQLGSQCPPPSLVAVNAGSAVPLSSLPLVLTILMIVTSCLVSTFVL